MSADPDDDYFLLAAMDWAALRAEFAPSTRAFAVASAVYRAAAVCHLLFQQGREGDALAHLRAVCSSVLGARLPTPGRRTTLDPTATLSAAADLFHRLRLAVAVPCAGVA